MKRLSILTLAAAFALCASSQVLEVRSLTKVPTSVPVDEAVISPDGKAVVASSLADESLTQVTLADGKMRRLTDNGSTYDLKFTDDSREIIYVEHSTAPNRLRFKQVKALRLDDLSSRTLSEPTRTLNGFTVAGKVATVVDNRQASTLSLATPRGAAKKVAASAHPTASIYYGQLMVTRNGVTTAINPNGTEGESYLWPSVSPDGSKVLYYRSMDGAYVCDIDGSNPRRLGILRAPAWIDDATVVGMYDLDDGQFITSSELVAVTLDGVGQVITPSDVVAICPSVSADGSRIAFSTPDGNLYYLDVELVNSPK